MPDITDSIDARLWVALDVHGFSIAAARGWKSLSCVAGHRRSRVGLREDSAV
jgi:hypothetical protein